jgi:hypothetical protein
MALKKGIPMTADGLSAQADEMGIDLAAVWAVLTVETAGCGFLGDRRPAILFERHVFRRETGGGKFDAIAPDLSNATPGGYGTRGDNQYRRLQRAIALDRRAALRSTSWGIGQVMGINAEMVGYEDVEAMVTGAESSEDEQLRAMFAFIRASKLRTALQNQDWKTFARRYNGPSFQENDYDTKLRQTFKRYRSEGVPDVRARAAQLHLIYKGFDPGVVDGIFGKKSRAALKLFQQSVGLSDSGDLDTATFAALQQ